MFWIYFCVLEPVDDPDRAGDVQLLLQIYLILPGVCSKVILEESIPILMSVNMRVPSLQPGSHAGWEGGLVAVVIWPHVVQCRRK